MSVLHMTKNTLLITLLLTALLIHPCNAQPTSQQIAIQPFRPDRTTLPNTLVIKNTEAR